MENKIEELYSKAQKLTIELIAHLTRSVGRVYFVNAAKIGSDVSTERLVYELKTIGFAVTKVESDAKPEVEVIDLSIDEDRCIELIREIKKAQDEIHKICEKSLDNITGQQ